MGVCPSIGAVNGEEEGVCTLLLFWWGVETSDVDKTQIP